MNFYRLAKRFLSIKSPRIKLISILGAHITGMRYIGIFIDPVMACNLRCRMCYFSDESKRPIPCPPMTADDITLISKSLFGHAIKMQIGCSTEPTLYKQLPALVKAASDAGIPYTEITTNGQLLTPPHLLKTLISNGLNGITISLHGTHRETYEHLMAGAEFSKLISLIDSLKEIKAKHPSFRIRINYTCNNLNAGEIIGIKDLMGDLTPDVIQIRPIQKMGQTGYSDFNLQEIYDNYDKYITPAVNWCHEKGIMCIYPQRHNLLEIDTKTKKIDEILENLTYYYISPPYTCNKPGFNPAEETFSHYHKRTHLKRRLLGLILSRGLNKPQKERESTKKLNYRID